MSHQPNSSSMPIKGILKHTQQTSNSHLKWDEENLQKTEEQKSSTMKVNEPKTPYIHYNAETDEVLNMPESMKSPDALEEPCDFTLDNGHDSDRSSASSSRKHRQVSVSDDGWESDDSNEDEQVKEQRRKDFQQKRAKHYNMGDVLRQRPDKEVDSSEDEDNVSPSHSNSGTAAVPAVHRNTE